MKHLLEIFLCALLLTGLLLAWSGCETDGSVSGSVYYGPNYREPWFRDDTWMDRSRGYRQRNDQHHDNDDRRGGDVYISPPRLPAPPRLPRL